ncbi:MAG: phosphatase PAP2 family protein [Pedobacter sp.]|nr:MAG: phosphatase PAP2 family protein [Pedobacter sp.]
MNDRRKKILFRTVAGLALGFALLTILVLLFPLSFIDRGISHRIQHYDYPIIDSFMSFVSWFGESPNSYLLVIATAVIFFAFKYKKEGWYVLATGISGVVMFVVKVAVNRPRPTADLVRIYHKTRLQSFPSGHTVFYVAFFGFLILLMYQLKSIPKPIRFVVAIFCAALVFLVPFSRVYLGAHWFTDVIAGFILGLICLLVLSYQYLKTPGKV